MPRIRNWHDLKFYRPRARLTYDHLDALFNDPINWGLIATHMPDMFRLAMSIKAGRVTPSTICGVSGRTVGRTGSVRRSGNLGGRSAPGFCSST
jgi:TnpA family transposase